MLTHINTNIIQYISIAGSIFLLILIIELVRRGRLKEEYSLLWLFFGLILLVLSVWRGALNSLSWLIGIAYPPAAVLLVLSMGAYAILIHYSTVISKLSDNNKQLVQELALLNNRIEQLEKKINNNDI